MVEYAIVYPNMGEYVDWGLVKSVAVEAERRGFQAFLIWDHYELPWSKRTFEAWALIASLASVTERIMLGTCVTPLPFRNPAQLAKIVSTIDFISGGRVIVGVGAGWYEPEFRGFSEWRPNKARVDMVEEGLEIMTGLMERGRLDKYHGSYYKLEDAKLDPKPVQKPRPPLFFGSFGRRMKALTARYGDGWIPTNITPLEYKRGLEEITSMASKIGRSRDSITPALQVFNPPQTREEALRVINEFSNAGCRLFAFVWRYPRHEMLERLRWFEKEVMASV